ncbi:hypothetical protein RQP46_009045 [Phenoliferia psychrophenolica]
MAVLLCFVCYYAYAESTCASPYHVSGNPDIYDCVYSTNVIDSFSFYNHFGFDTSCDVDLCGNVCLYIQLNDRTPAHHRPSPLDDDVQLGNDDQRPRIHIDRYDDDDYDDDYDNDLNDYHYSSIHHLTGLDMRRTSTFLLPKSESHRVSITPAHPQLRDLLICPPESNSLCVVRHSSIASHDRLGQKPIEYTRLGFAPSTLVYGCGLIAAGGQAAELALKAAAPSSTWCLQTNLCPTAPMNKINNSICIAPSPLSASTPRLLVSNNDATIKVFDVKGRIPDFGRAGRRRKRERDRWADDEDREGEEQVEEMGVHDEEGGECALEKVELGEIAMTTAINHCSVSPDGRRLVAVGDTNEIFLFDVNLGSGTYTKTHTFIGSDDASFSTDWSGTSDKFAVASQDGFVNVYDIRSLPSSSSSSSAYPPRKLAALKTTQSGPPGAARKVKFSPGRLSSELLAFTEVSSPLLPPPSFSPLD